MGSDKAALLVEGEPLATRAARLLRGVCDDVLIASGDGVRLSWLGLPQVRDAVAGAGPLGGIVAGLEAARHRLVAVLAVDMPAASPALFRLLAQAWAGEPAVVPLSARGLEPLHAVYAASAAPALRARLTAGRLGVLTALEELPVRVLERADWRPADPSGRFAANLNTPAEARAWTPRP
jgi:molybdopterin-guanine dinucleotide biosynthesis protein A